METTLQPYAMSEIDAMLEKAERDFAVGRCYTTEEVLAKVREHQSQLVSV